MKKILYAISAVYLMLMTSCSSVLSEYEEGIDDFVRFRLSILELFAHYPSDNESYDLVNEVITERQSGQTYKSLLKEKKEKGNWSAKKMLIYYNSLSISLSKPIYDESNTEDLIRCDFIEENSGIPFYFIKDNVNNMYTIAIDASDYEEERYQERIINEYKEMKSQKTDPKYAKKYIEYRIRHQYAGYYTDKKIMSQEFYYVLNKAFDLNDKVNEIGNTDYILLGYNYWMFSQDGYRDVASIDVELESSTSAVAYVSLAHEYDETDIVKVKFPMVYENGDWFVDDIYEIEDRRSLKERLNKDIKNLQNKLSTLEY
jgi:hypothetical protein